MRATCPAASSLLSAYRSAALEQAEVWFDDIVTGCIYGGTAGYGNSWGTEMSTSAGNVRSANEMATRESGQGIILLAVSLLILGLTLGLAVKLQSGPRPTTDVGGTHRSGSTPDINPLSAVDQALVATCRSNYEIAQEAVSAYEAEHGSAPGELSQVQPYVQDRLGGPTFTFTIDPKHPGQIDVATREHPASAGNVNCTYA